MGVGTAPIRSFTAGQAGPHFIANCYLSSQVSGASAGPNCARSRRSPRSSQAPARVKPCPSPRGASRADEIPRNCAKIGDFRQRRESARRIRSVCLGLGWFRRLQSPAAIGGESPDVIGPTVRKRALLSKGWSRRVGRDCGIHQRRAARTTATTVIPTRDATIGDTFVRISGQGFPLVFVHGFTTTSEFWREQAEEFSGICEGCIDRRRRRESVHARSRAHYQCGASQSR
jgi:hypothetical protein